MQVDDALLRVDGDAVAGLDEGDGAGVVRLGVYFAAAWLSGAEDLRWVRRRRT